jgi:hypothetical protein
MSFPCSILIATRNRPQILAETFARLREQGFGSYPLWVYDDASDERIGHSRAVVESWPGRPTPQGGPAARTGARPQRIAPGVWHALCHMSG